MTALKIFRAIPEDASFEELSALLEEACGGNAELPASASSGPDRQGSGNEYLLGQARARLRSCLVTHLGRCGHHDLRLQADAEDR